jgi:hypothetical protein
MRPTNTSRFRASLARVALRLALVALLALVAVDSGASTADVEARRQASSAAPSYRAKTFPLRVPNLRSVLQSAPPQAEEEEEEGGGTPSKAAQTKVDVGEFAGYTWCVPIPPGTGCWFRSLTTPHPPAASLVCRVSLFPFFPIFATTLRKTQFWFLCTLPRPRGVWCVRPPPRFWRHFRGMAQTCTSSCLNGGCWTWRSAVSQHLRAIDGPFPPPPPSQKKSNDQQRPES